MKPKQRLIFLRSWQGLYLLMLVGSLADRFSFFGWRAPERYEVIIFNVFFIVIAAASWILFEKKTRFSLFFLRVLSVLRMLVAIANATLFFAFISAYIPTGAMPWQWLIRLPMPLFILLCLCLFVLEVIFFIQAGKVEVPLEIPSQKNGNLPPKSQRS